MKKTVYSGGVVGKKYGIFNTKTHHWQFGIREDTPMLARARLFQKIGEDARQEKFETRELPSEREPAKPGLSWVTCDCGEVVPVLWLGFSYVTTCPNCGCELDIGPSAIHGCAAVWDLPASAWIQLRQRTRHYQARQAGI